MWQPIFGPQIVEQLNGRSQVESSGWNGQLTGADTANGNGDAYGFVGRGVCHKGAGDSGWS